LTWIRIGAKETHFVVVDNLVDEHDLVHADAVRVFGVHVPESAAFFVAI
jgi:hypothetical protein